MRRAKLFLSAVGAGLFIAVGATVFLCVENKTVGALFFTVGLFAICTRGLPLFTGRVCYALSRGKSCLIDLPVIYLGNFCGAAGGAMLVRLTRTGTAVLARAQDVCAAKTNDSLLSLFLLGVFCNILIYIAVDGFANNAHEAGKYLALFFGVAVFILCGFEHCVANMAYFTFAGAWDPQAFAVLGMVTLGNICGGLVLPILGKLTKENT